MSLQPRGVASTTLARILQRRHTGPITIFHVRRLHRSLPSIVLDARSLTEEDWVDYWFYLSVGGPLAPSVVVVVLVVVDVELLGLLVLSLA